MPILVQTLGIPVREATRAVRDLVLATDPPAYGDLYDTDWYVSAGVPLLGNTLNIQRAFNVAVHNFGASNDAKTKFFVVGGVPGAGKSRLSFELLRMWDSPERLLHLEREVGCSVDVIRLFMDFNNGASHAKGIDGDVMSDNLGARLAAQLLRKPLFSIFAMNNHSLRGLSVAEVLSAVLERASRGVRRCTAFLIVLSMDEYQSYLEQLTMTGIEPGATVSSSRRAELVQAALVSFKGMLSALKNFARDPLFTRRWKISILPVLSGTPVLGVPVLPTDKLDPEAMPPDPFNQSMAVELMSHVLTQVRGSEVSPLAALQKHVFDTLRQDAARAAVGDTGFRPRLLVNLATNALQQVRDTCAAVAVQTTLTNDQVLRALQLVDWKDARDKVALSFGKNRLLGRSFQRLLVEVALLRVPVRFDFPLHEPANLPIEHALSLAEATGAVELDRTANSEQRVVRMPLMQVKEWGTADFLPPFLMDVRRTWDWVYIEQLCAYMLKVRLNYYSPRELTVADLFPGCLGASAALGVRLRARGIAEVFEEQCKFIVRLVDVPARDMTVMASVYGQGLYATHTLDEGVFCACRGNARVDLRCSLPLATDGKAFAHFFVQLKHTTTNDTVTTAEINAWHAGVKAVTYQWRAGHDRTFFVFVSNRRVADGAVGELTGPFFDDRARHDLIVCTSGQLADFLTPTFVHRAFLPRDLAPVQAVTASP